ncbi:MAG TPA: WYL domain-containing transcriptional regulator [Sedimentisphaerales bacterium]|nr:WYL domain-containing transcriptional regulator [Sedimentisphaerales bacterium]
MKTSRISRVVQLLTVLQSGRSYNVDGLAQLLGTSRRTVFRDLNELEIIGVPYNYDRKTGGYSVDPGFFLPPIDLKLEEALSLFMLIHEASKHIQLPFKSSALSAALKIENNLPQQLRAYCNTALHHTSVKAPAQSPAHQLDATFALLERAIAKRRKVRMEYYSLFERNILRVELCPYHLLYNQRAWYILGLSNVHNSIRTFKLNRIRDLQIVDKCFVAEKNFDLADYLGRAWSMIPEGRVYNVKLLFSPKVAENVTEVLWHSTQTNKVNKDGSATVEFRVDGLGEITWWILGYGDQVQALAPRALRNRIATIAKKMVELNQRLSNPDSQQTS